MTQVGQGAPRRAASRPRGRAVCSARKPRATLAPRRRRPAERELHGLARPGRPVSPSGHAAANASACGHEVAVEQRQRLRRTVECRAACSWFPSPAGRRPAAASTAASGGPAGRPTARRPGRRPARRPRRRGRRLHRHGRAEHLPVRACRRRAAPRRGAPPPPAAAAAAATSRRLSGSACFAARGLRRGRPRLAVGARGHDQPVHRLDAPAAGDELGGQPVEQFGMARRRCRSCRSCPACATIPRRNGAARGG